MRVGKVEYRADESWPRIGKRRGRTKYRILFEDGDTCAKTSWNRLKARGFVVEKPPQDSIKRRSWSEAQEKALRRRHRACESRRSMACSFGRSEAGIHSKVQTLTNKNYAPKAGGELGKSHDRSMKWRWVAVEALKKLGSRGTAHMIHKEVEKMGVLEERHREKAPGNRCPKWHQLVALPLSRNPEFEKTGEKQAGGDGRMQSVWAYNPELAPPEPEDWGPDGKPRERKYKWMNAKERKAGYDNVHQNNSS